MIGGEVGVLCDVVELGLYFFVCLCCVEVVMMG